DWSSDVCSSDLLVVVTQLWLVASGNFAWLNWLTMLLAFAAVSDDVLRAVLPGLPVSPPSASGPGWFAVVVGAVTLLVLALSYRPARNLVSRRQQMNAAFNPIGRAS